MSTWMPRAHISEMAWREASSPDCRQQEMQLHKQNVQWIISCSCSVTDRTRWDEMYCTYTHAREIFSPRYHVVAVGRGAAWSWTSLLDCWHKGSYPQAGRRNTTGPGQIIAYMWKLNSVHSIRFHQFVLSFWAYIRTCLSFFFPERMNLYPRNSRSPQITFMKL